MELDVDDFLNAKREGKSDAEAVKEASPMERGRVKWFNSAKGYGFLHAESEKDLPPLDREDIFFHYSVIEVEGFKTIKSDQIVDFEVTEDRGKRATRVVPVED